MEQLVEWCGEAYDGLLVFDEHHTGMLTQREPGGPPGPLGLAIPSFHHSIIPSFRPTFY
jgi:hypothetical protein